MTQFSTRHSRRGPSFRRILLASIVSGSALVFGAVPAALAGVTPPPSSTFLLGPEVLSTTSGGGCPNNQTDPALAPLPAFLNSAPTGSQAIMIPWVSVGTGAKSTTASYLATSANAAGTLTISAYGMPANAWYGVGGTAGENMGNPTTGTTGASNLTESGSATGCNMQDSSPKPAGINTSVAGGKYLSVPGGIASTAGVAGCLTGSSTPLNGCASEMSFSFSAPVPAFGFYLGDAETSSAKPAFFRVKLDDNSIVEYPIYSGAAVGTPASCSGVTAASGPSECIQGRLPDVDPASNYQYAVTPYTNYAASGSTTTDYCSAVINSGTSSTTTRSNGASAGCGNGTTRWVSLVAPAGRKISQAVVVVSTPPWKLATGTGLTETLSVTGLTLFQPTSAGLAITKSTSTPSVTQGQNASFTITVTNNSTATAEGVSLSDVLPSAAGLSWSVGSVVAAGGAASPTNCVISAGTLTCGQAAPVAYPSTYSLPSGGSFTVTVTSPITASTPAGALPNTAAVEALGISPTTAIATVTVTAAAPASIRGSVTVAGTGAPIDGVTITLTGTATDGSPIAPMTTTTNASGTYSFTGLVAGTYTVTETQPTTYTDSLDAVGTGAATAGVAGNDVLSQITLAAGNAAINYNFTELVIPTVEVPVVNLQAAGIFGGFGILLMSGLRLRKRRTASQR